MQGVRGGGGGEFLDALQLAGLGTLPSSPKDLCPSQPPLGAPGWTAASARTTARKTTLPLRSALGRAGEGVGPPLPPRRAAGPSVGWRRHKAPLSPSPPSAAAAPAPAAPRARGCPQRPPPPPAPSVQGAGTLHGSRRCPPRRGHLPRPPRRRPPRPRQGAAAGSAAPAGSERGSSAERAPGAPTGDAPTHACPGRPRPFACRRLAQTHALTHPHTHTHAHSLRPPGLQLAAPRPPRRFASAMASPGSGFWSFGAEEGSAAAESPGTGRGEPSSRAGPARRSRGAAAAALPGRRSPLCGSSTGAAGGGGDRRRL